MQLEDLIEAYAIEGVARRTNITEEVIAKLLAKEFSTLKKTQALGAISIIEREYDVDLSSLRQECRAYFGGEDVLDGGLTVLRPIDQEKNVTSKFLSLALLVLLASGAWYFFTEYYDQRIDPFESQSAKPLDETSAKDQKVVSKEGNGSAENKSVAAESVSVEPDVEQQIEGIEASIRDIIEENGSEIAKETKKQKSDKQKSDKQEGDRQSTDEQSAEKQIAVEQTTQEQRTESVPGQSVESNKSAENEVPSPALVEAEQNEAEQIKTVATNEELVGAEQNETEKSAPVLKRESITLLPMRKMWFRLVNYDTKKVRTFKRKDRYKIDLREHAWLLATENAQFAIIDKDRFDEYQGEGKLFFLFDQEGVHQLSEEEYRAVEK